MLTDRRPILLANARVVDPSRDFDGPGDVLIADGTIRDSKRGIGAAGVPEGTDIINCAGHRLSTGQMEEVLATHPDVAECAVVGAQDALKGQVPLGFLVLKANVARDHAVIEREVVTLIRDMIGPVAAFKNVLCVERLPKTRSGKILRGTMQKIADGQPWKMPATIDDPAILEEIGQALYKAHLPA